jgi:flavodoxin
MSAGIVVYVTRTGHARELALVLGQQLGYPVAEIQDLVSRSGFIGWLRSGSQAAKKLATPISDPKADLSQVSTVVLVQPVWASAVVPPLRTWLENHRSELSHKKIALLNSHLGSPLEKLRVSFEKEFFPLTAFEGIKTHASQTEKQQKLKSFIEALKNQKN